MAQTVAVLQSHSGAWWDVINAARDAERDGRTLSISIDQNGRGETMTAAKVGEDMWSAHRTGN